MTNRRPMYLLQCPEEGFEETLRWTRWPFKEIVEVGSAAFKESPRCCGDAYAT